MSYLKLDDNHQREANNLYNAESKIMTLINSIGAEGSNRWLSIGRTDIEKGFMALRRGVTEKFKEKNESITNE